LKQVQERLQREGPRRGQYQYYEELGDGHVIIETGDSMYFTSM